jgi:hypothetical protein
LIPGRSAQGTAAVSRHGFLSAWVDFNRDGDWRDPSEEVIHGLDLPAGAQSFEFAVPDDTDPGETFARFRFSALSDAHWNGLAVDGEIEDHAASVQTLSGAERDPLQSTPERFVLYPNFPNPFNPSTEIRFELSEPVRVRMSVYDLMGRQVA